MVQMDCSLMSGLLGEALLKKTPAHLDAVFFCNSGTEAVEGAMKFARAATGRPRIVSLKGSYHGLSYGALSITGSETFQEGFGPFLADTEMVALGDLDALGSDPGHARRGGVHRRADPGQGRQLSRPTIISRSAQALCRKHGTLLICDEVQTGLGRTGKWFAFEHWDLEPDIVTLAKTLSGGYVPCGAIVTRRAIYQKVFSRLDRCVVHSSTFGRNNLAMACALASLTVLEDEKLVENSAVDGRAADEAARASSRSKHPFIKEVRGKGLMIAIEFHEPPQFRGKLAWRLMHKIDESLFTQLVVVPLLSQHRVLTQVAGHHMDVIKILPPLIIGREGDGSVRQRARPDARPNASGFPARSGTGQQHARTVRSRGPERSVRAPASVSNGRARQRPQRPREWAHARQRQRARPMATHGRISHRARSGNRSTGSQHGPSANRAVKFTESRTGSVFRRRMLASGPLWGLVTATGCSLLSTLGTTASASQALAHNVARLWSDAVGSAIGVPSSSCRWPACPRPPSESAAASRRPYREEQNHPHRR